MVPVPVMVVWRFVLVIEVNVFAVNLRFWNLMMAVAVVGSRVPFVQLRCVATIRAVVSVVLR